MINSFFPRFRQLQSKTLEFQRYHTTTYLAWICFSHKVIHIIVVFFSSTLLPFHTWNSSVNPPKKLCLWEREKSKSGIFPKLFKALYCILGSFKIDCVSIVYSQIFLGEPSVANFTQQLGQSNFHISIHHEFHCLSISSFFSKSKKLQGVVWCAFHTSFNWFTIWFIGILFLRQDQKKELSHLWSPNINMALGLGLVCNGMFMLMVIVPLYYQ